MRVADNSCDILLINAFSWNLDKRPCYLPYGVLYLASFLRNKKIKVGVYDRNTDFSLDIKKCIDHFKACRPKVVGISVLTGPVINDALKISKAIKAISPDTYIVWGGLYPTLFPKYVLEESSIDFIIQGEGEFALYELLQNLFSHKNYKDVGNLGFKDAGKIILNPIRQELLDLNDNPLAAWDLIDIRYYIANRFFASRVLTLSTSRGCPFKCAFCFNQGLPHQRWRSLNAGNMYKQIEYLKNNYHINGIQFYEDSFDTDKQRVKEFCRFMIDGRMKVNWSHFSNIIYSNEELLKIERLANCKYIEYGVESGSDRILKMIDKRQDVKEIEEAFAVCKKVGLRSAALFMIGYPTETRRELQETVDLVERLPAHILICTIYRPYPGTPLYEYCVKNRKFKVPESLSQQAEFYRFSHMNEDVYNMSDVPTSYLLKLQKSFYAKFAIKEALLCLKEVNLGLLVYYLKQQLNPGTLSYTIKSLFIRMGIRFKVNS